MKFNSNTRLTIPNSSGNCSVIIRVTYRGKRIELYTGITVPPSQWDGKKSRVKHGCIVDGYQFNVLNKKITEQEQFIEDYFNDSEVRGTLTSLSDLKERFNHKYKFPDEKQSDEFFFLFDKFIKEMAGEKGWQKDMVDVYERLKRKVKDFKADIKFSDLSTETMDKFKVHLSQTMYNEAIDKNLTYFKSFITWAKNHNYKIHEEYFTYNPKLPKMKKAVRYLTLDELDTIYNLQLDGREGLERARDIFIFQCYTALRISDVSRLKRENIIKDENGDYYIDIVTEKDDDRVHYKLAQRAVDIYLKYADNIYENDLAFPIISQQKYNEHLKTLGKAANLKGEWIDYEYRLNEKIVVKTPKSDLSSHTARRTFIVTAMNEGVALDLIALITSHSDVKAMKPYIKMNRRGTNLVIDAMNNATSKKRNDGDED